CADESSAITSGAGGRACYALLQMRQRSLHLVYQHQAKIARRQARQRRVDSQELPAHLIDTARARRVREALPQQRQHFAVGASALALVFIEHHVVECGAQNLGLAAQVFVAPVACAAYYYAAPCGGQGIYRTYQCLDGVGVVAIVGNDGGALVVEYIEAARDGMGIADESGKATPDGVPFNTQRPGRGDGRHRIVDLKGDGAAAGQRDVAQIDADFFFSLRGHDGSRVAVHDPMALRAVRADKGMCGVAGKERYGTGAGASHVGHHGVRGVEYRRAAGMYVLHDDPLDDSQVFDGADIAQPQVVAHSKVGHDSDIATVEGQALAQYPAARRFEHRRVHARVRQHAARAARPAAVARVDALGADVYAIGICHPDALAGRR